MRVEELGRGDSKFNCVIIGKFAEIEACQTMM